MENSALKIITYNIHSGRSGEAEPVRDYALTAATIKELCADIIGVQEVGNHPCANSLPFPMECEPTEYIAEHTGYYSYFACSTLLRGKYPYGNAIFSKYPIKSARTVTIPDPPERALDPDNDYYETRSVLVAEIDVLGGITVLVTHFGLMPAEHRSAVETVLKLVSEIKTPVIFMGDLNMTPDHPTLAPLFEALCDIEDGRGEPITWPALLSAVGDYEATVKKISDEHSAPRKIDYIFISRELSCDSSEVVASLASDHMPYIGWIRRVD